MNHTAAHPPPGPYQPPGTPPGPHDPPSNPPPQQPPRRNATFPEPANLRLSGMYTDMKTWHPQETCSHRADRSMAFVR